jgi:hypothetical protein
VLLDFALILSQETLSSVLYRPGYAKGLKCKA